MEWTNLVFLWRRRIRVTHSIFVRNDEFFQPSLWITPKNYIFFVYADINSLIHFNHIQPIPLWLYAGGCEKCKWMVGNVEKLKQIS